MTLFEPQWWESKYLRDAMCQALPGIVTTMIHKHYQQWTMIGQYMLISLLINTRKNHYVDYEPLLTIDIMLDPNIFRT